MACPPKFTIVIVKQIGNGIAGIEIDERRFTRLKIFEGDKALINRCLTPWLMTLPATWTATVSRQAWA